MEIFIILNAIDFQLTDTGLQSKTGNPSAGPIVLECLEWAQTKTMGQAAVLNLRSARADRKMPNMLTAFLNVENIRVDCGLLCASNS